MIQYRTALFIGRFQPFHKGHLYSLLKCLEIAEQVTIVVAKANVSGTQDDPWDARTRKMMICDVVRSEGIESKIAHIFSCPDYPSDSKWVSEIKKRAGEFDVVVSNNPWVFDLMKAQGYATYQTGLFNREELEGQKIRALMRAGEQSWKERVPEVVINLIG
jgi:nicotinamide-nucleotide adenylyltransferase